MRTRSFGPISQRRGQIKILKGAVSRRSVILCLFLSQVKNGDCSPSPPPPLTLTFTLSLSIYLFLSLPLSVSVCSNYSSSSSSRGRPADPRFAFQKTKKIPIKLPVQSALADQYKHPTTQDSHFISGPYYKGGSVEGTSSVTSMSFSAFLCNLCAHAASGPSSVTSDVPARKDRNKTRSRVADLVMREQTSCW